MRILEKIISLILGLSVCLLLYNIIVHKDLSFNVNNLIDDYVQTQKVDIGENAILEGPYKVLKVVDGDTIRVDIDGKDTTVRLIGIDTPESVNPDETKNSQEGVIASDYTKSIISKNVYLEFDVESKDQYDRLLAYVYLDDGTFLNEKIIEDGYAYTMNINPNVKYQDIFLKAFNEARENKKGLWHE